MIFDISKPDGTPRKLMVVSYLHSKGWKAETRFHERIKKTYECSLANEGKYKSKLYYGNVL